MRTDKRDITREHVETLDLQTGAQLFDSGLELERIVPSAAEDMLNRTACRRSDCATESIELRLVFRDVCAVIDPRTEPNRREKRDGDDRGNGAREHRLEMVRTATTVAQVVAVRSRRIQPFTASRCA